MSDLDDILKRHVESEDEQKKREEEAAALAKQERDKINAAFKERVDQIILPALRGYKNDLTNAGYLSSIDDKKYMDAREPRPDKQFYDKVIFEFDTEKMTASRKGFSSKTCVIVFQAADPFNVAISFSCKGKSVRDSATVEGTEFAIKEMLKKLFGMAFPS